MVLDASISKEVDMAFVDYLNSAKRLRFPNVPRGRYLFNFKDGITYAIAEKIYGLLLNRKVFSEENGKIIWPA